MKAHFALMVLALAAALPGCREESEDLQPCLGLSEGDRLRIQPLPCVISPRDESVCCYEGLGMAEGDELVATLRRFVKGRGHSDELDCLSGQGDIQSSSDWTWQWDDRPYEVYRNQVIDGVYILSRGACSGLLSFSLDPPDRDSAPGAIVGTSVGIFYEPDGLATDEVPADCPSVCDTWLRATMEQL